MKTQLLPVRVETVKQIVLNWSLESRGQVFQYKKRFKSAHQAVKSYLEHSEAEYYDRYGHGPSDARQERLRRRLVPVFKNMLK
jgi:septation ring formation regulator EzrA